MACFSLERIEGIAEDERRLQSDLPDLLKVIDAFVLVDEKPPGFDGCACLLVDTSERRFIWRGVFTAAAQVRAGFVDELPEETGSALLLDAAAATAILKGKPIPENSRPVRYGDQQLIQTFFARYFRAK